MSLLTISLSNQRFISLAVSREFDSIRFLNCRDSSFLRRCSFSSRSGINHVETLKTAVISIFANQPRPGTNKRRLDAHFMIHLMSSGSYCSGPSILIFFNSSNSEASCLLNPWRCSWTLLRNSPQSSPIFFSIFSFSDSTCLSQSASTSGFSRLSSMKVDTESRNGL